MFSMKTAKRQGCHSPTRSVQALSTPLTPGGDTSCHCVILPDKTTLLACNAHGAIMLTVHGSDGRAVGPLRKATFHQQFN
jgi:hypothetical protein